MIEWHLSPASVQQQEPRQTQQHPIQQIYSDSPQLLIQPQSVGIIQQTHHLPLLPSMVPDTMQWSKGCSLVSSLFSPPPMAPPSNQIRPSRIGKSLKRKSLHILSSTSAFFLCDCSHVLFFQVVFCFSDLFGKNSKASKNLPTSALSDRDCIWWISRLKSPPPTMCREGNLSLRERRCRMNLRISSHSPFSSLGLDRCRLMKRKLSRKQTDVVGFFWSYLKLLWLIISLNSANFSFSNSSRIFLSSQIFQNFLRFSLTRTAHSRQGKLMMLTQPSFLRELISQSDTSWRNTTSFELSSRLTASSLVLCFRKSFEKCSSRNSSQAITNSFRSSRTCFVFRASSSGSLSSSILFTRLSFFTLYLNTNSTMALKMRKSYLRHLLISSLEGSSLNQTQCLFFANSSCHFFSNLSRVSSLP